MCIRDRVRITREENEHDRVLESTSITAASYENAGKLEYVQILKLEDYTAPVITLAEVNTCLQGVGCGEQKRFAITATDCNTSATEKLVYNWTLSSNDTQLATGEGASFEATVLPKETYTVKWSVSDNCGNTAWEEAKYEFQDCKLPSPYCLNGLAIELMDNASVEVWARDIERNSSDNCTTADNLRFRIWHNSLGSAPNQITEVLALPEAINFSCAMVGSQEVSLYVIDEANNWEFCTTYVNVQDNKNVCMSNEAMALIDGTIMDWKQQTVEEVHIDVANSNSMMTREDGYYHFDLEMYNDYMIRPEKDDRPLNGVSTFDLVLISKHILGITEFENPYQMIAADVNLSLIHI